MKNRLIGLDTFRIICALFVCLFHLVRKLDADFGFMQPFISMGAIFMTAFFMMSGFLLFENNKKIDLINHNNYKKFIKKRLFTIMPMYYVAIIIFYILYWDSSTDLLLIPIEIFCIQSLFPNIFLLTHNGGTWFISCILFCYLIYPLVQSLLLQMKDKTKIIMILAITFILMYMPFVVFKMSLPQIYSNPFFRILEFTIGATIASFKTQLEKNKIIKQIIHSWLFSLFCFLVLIIIVTIAVNREFHVLDYMYYNLFCLPLFAAIILGLSCVKSETLSKSRTIKYLSSISYCFFIAQLYSNSISRTIINKYNISNNAMIIGIGFIICLIICILLYEIFDRNFKKFFKKYN